MLQNFFVGSLEEEAVYNWPKKSIFPQVKYCELNNIRIYLERPFSIHNHFLYPCAMTKTKLKQILIIKQWINSLTYPS